VSSDEQRTNVDQGEEPRVVVRDRRRIDPETGQVRGAHEAPVAEAPPAAAPDAPSAEPDPEAELKLQLEERTADLQRLQAEYANYRKRIDRDREVVVTAAKASVTTELLAVLDDIERVVRQDDLVIRLGGVHHDPLLTRTEDGTPPPNRPHP